MVRFWSHSVTNRIVSEQSHVFSISDLEMAANDVRAFIVTFKVFYYFVCFQENCASPLVDQICKLLLEIDSSDWGVEVSLVSCYRDSIDDDSCIIAVFVTLSWLWPKIVL